MAVGRLNPVASISVLEIAAVCDVYGDRRRRRRMAVYVGRERRESMRTVACRTSIPRKRVRICRIGRAYRLHCRQRTGHWRCQYRRSRRPSR